jgi:PAS domain-containing protein
MAGLIRAFAWRGTPLGPVEAWPQSLRTAVDTILGIPIPAVILWGPDHIQIYNDAFIAIARDRHPHLLGQPAAIGWADVFEAVHVPLCAALAGETMQLRGYIGMVEGATGPEERVFDANWSPLRDESGEVAGALQILIETTEWHRTEAALDESEERLGFLLSLSDRLRNVVDAQEVMTITAEMFGKRLGLAVAHFLIFAADEDSYILGGAYSDGRIEAGLQKHGRLSDHGPGWGHQLRAGEAVFSDDHETRGGADADASRSFGVRSGSAVPLIRNGRMVALFSTAHPEPRRWTDAERQLRREVAERAWAAVLRARSEAGLRESEERLRQFGNASQDILWIRDANTLQWQYLTPAIEGIYGLSREEALSGDDYRNSQDLIVTYDRARAVGSIERVLAGEREDQRQHR